MTYIDDKSAILPTHHLHRQHHHTGAVDESDVKLRLGGTTRVWKAIKQIVQIVGLALLGTALYFALYSAVWCPPNPDGSFPSDCFVSGEVAVSAPRPLLSVPLGDGNDGHLGSNSPVSAWQGSKTHEAYTVYPLHTDKDIYISVQGGKTEVVISRLPDMTPDQAGGIGLQTIYDQEGHESSAMFMASDDESHLTVEGRAKTMHRVYILLPAALTHLPRLQITASQLSFNLTPSTLEVRYDVLRLSTDSLFSLAPELPAADDIEIDAIEGSIEGTFNITRRLHLQTRRGDINATVHVAGDAEPGPRPGPHVEARTQEDNVDVTIASLQPDVDAQIAATSTMGDVSVNLSKVPTFFGRFSALTTDGCIDVYTEDEGKALHFTADRPGQVEGHVEPADADESSACEDDGLQPMYTIQTDPPYLEPTFHVQTGDHLRAEPTYTIQTQTDSPLVTRNRGPLPEYASAPDGGAGLVRARTQMGSISLNL